MKLLHQHFPAIMGSVGRCNVCRQATCDGRHLHPGTVRFLLKMKGLDKVIAITDSIMAAGLPDGEYMLGVNPFDQPGVEAYKKNMFALLNKPGYEKESEAIRKKL